MKTHHTYIKILLNMGYSKYQVIMYMIEYIGWVKTLESLREGEIMVSNFLSILRLIEKKDSLTSCLYINNNQSQSEGVLIGQYFFELHDGNRYSITLRLT